MAEYNLMETRAMIAAAANNPMPALASVVRLLDERQKIATDALMYKGDDENIINNYTNMVAHYNEKIAAVLGLKISK